MKKFWIVVVVIVIIAAISIFAFRWFDNNQTDNKNSNTNNTSKYNTARIATEAQNAIHPEQVKETELYRFSTPLKSKDKNRLTNIKITCSRINETIVKAGKEFSFCDVVGQPNSADGYKPADAFGKNNKIIQAIGGRKLSSKYYCL